MNHPVWELELGGGLLIAAVSIVHVTLAQLSAGTALLLPILEARARRAGDGALGGWVRRHAGALAGGVRMASLLAGGALWLVLAVVAPAATEALSRALLFPFLLAWLAAGVSLAAGLAWARGFERLSPAAHRAAGWLGAGASLLALLLSDAVVSFMAEPDAAFDDAGLLGALSTPLWLPSSLLRLAACAGLAGLLVLATAWREAPLLRARLARLGALAALPGAAVGPLAAWLCLRAAGPAQLELVQGEVGAATLGFTVATWSAALGAAGLAAVALLAPRRPALAGWPVAALLLALAGAASAGGEFVREAVRRPWVVGAGPRGAMYATGLSREQVFWTREHGLLPGAGFSALARPGAALDGAGRGAEVFRLACRPCHTVAGPRGIRRVVDGLPPEAIAVGVARLHKLRGRMPPFPGTAADAADLVTWLAGLDGVVEGPPLPLPPGDVVAAGRRVLEFRCLMCHRDIPLRRRVAGWTADFAYEALGRLPKLQPAMPPFAGDDAERRALAAYLAALGAGQAE